MIDDSNPDDTNPYASPRSIGWDPSLSEPTGASQPEQPMAWRQGDVLILPRKGAVLPRACLICNRSSGLMKIVVTTFANRSILLLLPLFLLPFVGSFCVMPCWFVLLRVGWAAEIRIWVRWWVALALAVCDYAIAVPLALAGNVLTGIGIIARSMPFLLAGGVCLAASVMFAFVPLRLLTGLKFDLTGGRFVSVRGVHPEYLDRLPELHADQPPSS